MEDSDKSSGCCARESEGILVGKM